MDFSFSEHNCNSVETLPDFQVRVAFTVNYVSVFREDMGIVTLHYRTALSIASKAAGKGAAGSRVMMSGSRRSHVSCFLA